MTRDEFVWVIVGFAITFVFIAIFSSFIGLRDYRRRKVSTLNDVLIKVCIGLCVLLAGMYAVLVSYDIQEEKGYGFDLFLCIVWCMNTFLTSKRLVHNDTLRGLYKALDDIDAKLQQLYLDQK